MGIRKPRMDLLLAKTYPVSWEIDEGVERWASLRNRIQDTLHFKLKSTLLLLPQLGSRDLELSEHPRSCRVIAF